MPASINRLNAHNRIAQLRLADSVAAARKLQPQKIPASWPDLPDPRGIDTAGFNRLMQRHASRPDHPVNWHQRAIDRALSQPRARNMYMLMRQNLWKMKEFFELREKARIILEIIIDLARDEAFPWYLNVQAREVMRLARLNHASMAMRLAELECLAITRPARRINLGEDAAGVPRWPRKDNNWGVDSVQPLEPIAQWVVRYRRGVPGNANRAAWWINYDLLCSTQRVLPCFEVSINSLARTYENRNRRMGTQPSRNSEDGIKALIRTMTLRGPIPPLGMRAPLWEGGV